MTQELLFWLPVDVRKQAIFVDVTHEVHGIASHWQDDLVLAAAVSGEADYLVTRDKEFRQVGEYQGVIIRTPAEFLVEVDEAGAFAASAIAAACRFAKTRPSMKLPLVQAHMTEAGFRCAMTAVDSTRLGMAAVARR